jgi:AraC-like DNA-binding protein
MDSRLREIEQLGVRISLDSRITGLLSVRENIEVTHRFTMYQVINDFRAYLVANPFISRFYVYMKNSDVAIASNASYSSRALVATWHGVGNDAYQLWQKRIDMVEGKQYLLQERISSQGVAVPYLSFMQPLPIGSIRDSNATLVIFLDKTVLNRIVNGTKMINQGSVLVLNPRDELLFATTQIPLPNDFSYASLADSTDNMNIKIDGSDYVISHIRSAVTDWIYVSIIPLDIYMREAIRSRTFALIGFLVCILLGGALIYLFIRRNYNPIRNIVSMIANKSGTDFHKGVNEYHFIHNAVAKVFDEKEEINDRLLMQNTALRNNYIARNLKGSPVYRLSYEDAQSLYSLHFKSSIFAVMLFYIDDYDKAVWSDSQGSGRLIYTIVQNIVEELTAMQHHTGIVVEVDDFFACLINLTDVQPDKHKDSMFQIADKARTFIKEHFRVTFTVSLSGTMCSFTSLPQLYQQAVEALEYRLLADDSGVLCYDEIRWTNKDIDLYHSISGEEQKFANCLRAGDYEQAKVVFQAIIAASTQTSPHLSMEFIKVRMLFFVNTLINALAEQSVLYKNKYFQEENPIERLFNAHNIHELQDRFLEILDQVKTLHEDQETDNSLVNQAKKYVQDHYQDMNLNVSLIADQLGTTTPHLSRIFGKKTGTRLLEFIHRYRLDCSKEMIRQGQFSIKDISKMNGFINSDAYIRIFKKYEGITPGRFREIAAK